MQQPQHKDEERDWKTIQYLTDLENARLQLLEASRAFRIALDDLPPNLSPLQSNELSSFVCELAGQAEAVKYTILQTVEHPSIPIHLRQTYLWQAGCPPDMYTPTRRNSNI